MKKVVLIPDSFKGSLSSKEICKIMKSKVIQHFSDCEVVEIPVADGGEGSVDCFLAALGGERINLSVTGPFFNKVEAFYGLLADGKTAIIEMAACAGLPMVGKDKNPLVTTTYGVGELIAHAANNGVSKIILGIGGSCTNDAGAGAAAALGTRFYDDRNSEFIPIGGTLKNIKSIDNSNVLPLLKDIEITVMCDVDNPMYGERGAAYVFAPQKGADDRMVRELDEGLINAAEVIKKDLLIDVANIKGGGAAGGMGSGMVAFLSADLCMGIDVVLNTVDFESIALDSDLIFTGEGKIDSQSLRGKVVAGVARRAKHLEVPVVAVVGYIGDGIENIYDLGISAVFSINQRPMPLDEAIVDSMKNLDKTMDNIMRFIKAMDVV